MSFVLYVTGGLLFVMSFLAAGHMSVARRMATHLDAWVFTDKLGSIGASILILGMMYFAIRIIMGLLSSSSKEAGANSQGAA